MGSLWQEIIVNPMAWGLNEFAHYLWGSYALAIIALTVFIKLCLLPLTVKQLQSARKQQLLQPQMQELRQRYAKDKQKLQEETMRLYRENDANPITGCLPTLLQLPILYGLYNAMYAELRNPSVHASFLWVHNLAQPDFPPNGLFILPLLAGALQWVQQRMMMNSAANQDPQQKMMTQMMQFMPLMVVFFGYRFPGGLALYWVTSTLIAIIQQYFINGWGTLPDVFPFVRRIPAPNLMSGVVVARDLPPATPPTSATRQTKGADQAPVGGTSANGVALPKTGAAPSKNGAAKVPTATARSGPGQPGAGIRRGGQDGSRPRPSPRKQGSKR